MLIQEHPLRKLSQAIVEHTGSDPAEAEIVSDHLVRANLSGHDSHGVGMLPQYVKNFRAGLLKPNTPVLQVKDDGAIMVFDGQAGYGQRVAKDAMDAAIARCHETGVVLMTLRNAHHIGRIGTYGEYSIAAGLVSVHFVNVVDHEPAVVPFGGSAARFITNPVCIAMPGTDNSQPILLDMATSRIAAGKVRVAMNKGVDLPDGMLITPQGQPTNNPGSLFTNPKQSALLPFGEHKGSGMALFCELLGGALSGGGTIQPGNPRRGGITNNMFTLVVDPARLVDQVWLNAEIDALMTYVKSSTPADPAVPVMVAGDPERKSMAERQAEGIPVDPATWEELLVAGETLGLSREQAQQLAAV
ncbi:MAG: malate/lactate/ureidoglycolate dehydrogenase [Gammaproteobacteria bacterium]